MQEAVESVFSAHTDWDRTLYDSDKDGFLDGIEIIYKSSRNYYSGTGKGSTIWWNFTGRALLCGEKLIRICSCGRKMMYAAGTGR